MTSIATTSSTLFQVKAKYIPNSDGSFRLASVQQFSVPKFRPTGWEDRDKKDIADRTNGATVYNPYDYNDGFEVLPDDVDLDALVKDMRNTHRATRRAKIAAMDYILCNPELDMFATLTYEQSDSVDRLDYEECYSVLRRWLTNRVTRKGLLYVAVCERQKKGGIHFHLLCNSSALSLARARSPYTNRYLTHIGKPLYNITDWTAGFSSCEFITGDCCRDKVAKYIFKYMSKETFGKIGGRYFLHGGKLKKPRYLYGDVPEEFFDGSDIVNEREVVITDRLVWKEFSFV